MLGRDAYEEPVSRLRHPATTEEQPSVPELGRCRRRRCWMLGRDAYEEPYRFRDIPRRQRPSRAVVTGPRTTLAAGGR
jgi:hypothetical protein